MRRIRGLPSGALLLVAPGICLGLLFLANIVQGTVTAPRSSGLTDIAYALHLTDTPPEPTPYPLMRDLTSLVLFFILGLTVWVVHVQWKRMERAIPEMLESGAISSEAENLQKIRELMVRANAKLKKQGALGGLYVLAAVLIMLFIIIGELRSGIFEVIADRSLSEEDRLQVALEAYGSWWAGFPNHLLGGVSYFLLGTIGVYVILLQNAVGFVCIQLVWRMRNLRFGIDRFDGDGAGGWSPIGRVLSTVYLSLLFHAFGISLVLFIVMGRNGWPFAAALLAIWAGVAPTYVFFPLWVFRRAMRYEKEEAVRQYLTGARSLLDASDEVSGSDQVVYEALARNGAASIRKIRTIPLRPAELYGAIFGQLLPISAVMLEVYLTVSRGS